jgi:hypothetical protein
MNTCMKKKKLKKGKGPPNYKSIDREFLAVSVFFRSGEVRWLGADFCRRLTEFVRELAVGC